MEFVDTHFHIENKDSLGMIIDESRSNKVNKFIISFCSSSDLNVYKTLDDVEGVFYSLGYHPSEAGSINDDDLDYLETLIKKDRKVVALGEIGLDYHYDGIDKDKQKELFEKQLLIAQRNNLPVVIHTRDAFFDTINILRRYHVAGVIHCFNGSLEVAREYIKLGYYLGIGGVITFKNCKLKEVIKEIGLDNIVLETDSPYLSPEPLRGVSNSPCNVPIVALFVADLLGVNVSYVASKTTKNAIRLFDLEK